MKQMKAYEDSLREMFEDSCHPLKSSQQSVDGDTHRTEKEHGNLQKDTSFPEISPKKMYTVTHAEGETLVRREKTDNEPVIADISKASFTEKLMDELGRFDFHKMTRSAPMYTPGTEEFSRLYIWIFSSLSTFFQHLPSAIKPNSKAFSLLPFFQVTWQEWALACSS